MRYIVSYFCLLGTNITHMFFFLYMRKIFVLFFKYLSVMNIFCQKNNNQ